VEEVGEEKGGEELEEGVGVVGFRISERMVSRRVLSSRLS